MNTPKKPPALLPCGKRNPEYTKWYREHSNGRRIDENWNNSEKGKLALIRYRKTDKYKEACKRHNERRRLKRQESRKRETPDEYANRILREVGQYA